MSIQSKEVELLAKDWFRRCRESQMAHYEYGSLLESRHLWLGIPAVLLSTIVGTAVFASWESNAGGDALRILFGLLSMLAAAVAALQTFLNMSDRAAKHKAAGAAYGAIRRELELFKTLPCESEEETKSFFLQVKERMDDLAASSPSIPSKHKRRIDDKLKSRIHDRIFQLQQREESNAESGPGG
ncbi:SLATT domain-containing protein [Haloferula chungangensis]|uniref:SLATT domain-containing protein n=1 Tax=Haloferula chungangensis TaxID=1048331 RepID=A0ABW2LA07_9BACT